MQTIIVATDFSPAAQSALDYTCALLHDKAPVAGEVLIVLLHTYTVPATYTNDGVSVAAMQEAIAYAASRLAAEQQRANSAYRDVRIRTQLETGGLRERLETVVAALHPAAVVVGAGDYSNLWSWGADTLAALRALPVPMLVVPGHLRYTGLQTIGYACNCKNISTATPIAAIRAIALFTQATLHVIHIDTPEVARQPALGGGVDFLKEQLAGIPVEYHHLEHRSFLEALARYIEAHPVGLLLLTPRRYGAWASLFRKSNTKAIARLNRLPVLALRERG